METASDPDSDDQLCVRIWWSLILMERWHATGTGKPAQIPDTSVVAPPGLENILGEVCFYLISKSPATASWVNMVLIRSQGYLSFSTVSRMWSRTCSLVPLRQSRPWLLS